MTDRTPGTPSDASEQDRTTTSSSAQGWGVAPAAGSTATLDADTVAAHQAPANDPYAAPAPYAAQNAYAPQNPYTQQDPYGAWNGTTPAGPTAWYGQSGTTKRRGGPRPPWFWPVVAVVVGIAALLAGGGIGYAVGHAIGGSGQSSTQVPGTNGGTNQFPGGGTGQFPGNGTQGAPGTGSGTGTGTGSTSSDTANS